MKKIEKGIVFSNDIKRILKGNNALGFNYKENGMSIPDDSFLTLLREDFKKDVNKVFDNNITILNEDEMLYNSYESITDIYGRYPHCFIR